MGRLTLELDVENLKRTRGHVSVLLCDELVGKCCAWLKEFSVLHKKHERSIIVSNIYLCLAVMLFSECTGYSFIETVDILGKFGRQKLDQEILDCINTNVLAYSVRGRGEDDSLVWNTESCQTVMLGQFKRVAFSNTSRIFLAPNRTTSSLDDDLMGTRAADNQVRTISNRKADGKGHAVDVLADAQFRVVLQMRFRRRHNKLDNCILKMIANLIEINGDMSSHGLTVVADGGYARKYVLNALMGQGLSCFGVMPEFMLKCHPILGNPCLKIALFVEDDSEDEDRSEETFSVGEKRVVYDRLRESVMEDGSTFGPAVKVAKPWCKSQDRTTEEVTAIAVREYGTAKHSKIIRFMYSMQIPWVETPFKWVAVSYEMRFAQYPFTTRDKNGRIVDPNGQTYRSVIEQHPWQYCDVLTVGQRYADWFVMRQFRVTATVEMKIVTCCPALREELQNDRKEIPVKISDAKELGKRLYNSWSTTKRSSEAMMRGTSNENAILNFMKRQLYTKGLFSVGLSAVKNGPRLSSLPDATITLDMTKIPEPFYASQVLSCTVEAKTSVSSTTLQNRTSIATKDLLFLNYNNPDVKKYIFEDHFGQLLHQVITATVIAAFHVAASESHVMFTIVVIFDETIIQQAAQFVDNIVKSAIGWSHEDDADVLLDKYDDDVKDLLTERLPFWRCVNKKIREKGPFMLIRIFRHLAQSFYAKTRGGVDGNSQIQ